MNSGEVIQLLAKNIQHPDVSAFMQSQRMKVLNSDGGWHSHTNTDETLQFLFWSCSAKVFKKTYMQPLIDAQDSPEELNKSQKTTNLFLTEIIFSPGFSGRLPFNLCFNMDKAAISQKLNTTRLRYSKGNNEQPPENHIIEYHCSPHILSFQYKNKKLQNLHIGFTQDWQVEIFNLYQQYPLYGQRKAKTRMYRFWRSELNKDVNSRLAGTEKKH